MMKKIIDFKIGRELQHELICLDMFPAIPISSQTEEGEIKIKGGGIMKPLYRKKLVSISEMRMSVTPENIQNIKTDYLSNITAMLQARMMLNAMDSCSTASIYQDENWIVTRKNK